MKNHLHRSEILKHLDPDFRRLLPEQETITGEIVDPIQLLSGERLDILTHYLYAKLHLLDAAQEWRSKVLFESFQAYQMDGNDPEQSYQSYKKAFDSYLVGVYTDGFEEKYPLIPVKQNNILMGDARRLATALLYNQRVCVVNLDQKPDKLFDQIPRLAPEVADAVMLEYCRLCPNMLILVVFPVATGKDNEICSIIQDYGRIIYQKEIDFTKIGQYNLISMLYFNMHWISPAGDITYGVCHHVDHRFFAEGPVKFFFLKIKDISKSLELKMKIRGLFDLKNFSVHINDTHDETVWTAEQILNPNSVYFLNHAQPWLSLKFLRSFEAYTKSIIQQGLENEHVLLLGDSVLAVYGLRDSNHVDGLGWATENSFFDPSTQKTLTVEHNPNDVQVKDLFFDPHNFFYFRGQKFLDVRLLERSPISNKRVSDRKLRLLIASIEGKSPNRFRLQRNLRFIFKTTYKKVTHINLKDIKQRVPAPIKLLLKRVVHKLFPREDQS